MTKIKNSEVPLIILGSEDKIRRLENIGFNWKKKGKPDSFEKHFEGLKAYKVKYGRCDAGLVLEGETIIDENEEQRSAPYQRIVRG